MNVIHVLIPDECRTPCWYMEPVVKNAQYTGTGDVVSILYKCKYEDICENARRRKENR